MVEIKKQVMVEKIVMISCNVCAKEMVPYIEPQAKLYFDDPVSGEFPTMDFCTECYGKLVDHINVDMKKELRNNQEIEYD